MRFEGVFVAVTTPWSNEGTLNIPLFREHLTRLARAGVHGFVPCGTTGESATLQRDEWAQIIETTVQTSKTLGLKTIAGCGSNDTATTLEKIRHAHELGCDAALLVTPYYNKPTPAGVRAHYLHLADRAGLPLIPYNVPSRTNVSLSAELITELLKHPQISGVKEASGSLSQWLQIASANCLKEKSLLAGDDDALSTVLALGGSGTISAAANVAPAKFVRIWNLIKENRWQEAFSLQIAIQPLVQALFCETNPGPIKYALHRLYGEPNTLRLPLVSVQPQSAALIDAALGKDLHAI
jgi:4-hydroxy-tetrahydrodipicolinate synthase